LKHAYLHVDLIAEQDIVDDNLLAQYQLLFISDPQVRTAAQQKIKEWVRAGGHLWAEVGATSFDEYNQPSTVLDEAFGVRSRTMDVGGRWPTEPQSWWYESKTKKFDFQSRGVLRTDGTHSFPLIEIPVWGARMDAFVSTGA